MKITRWMKLNDTKKLLVLFVSLGTHFSSFALINKYKCEGKNDGGRYALRLEFIDQGNKPQKAVLKISTNGDTEETLEEASCFRILKRSLPAIVENFCDKLDDEFKRLEISHQDVENPKIGGLLTMKNGDSIKLACESD